MNNLTIIGFVGGNAEVIDLKQQDGSTVTTFSVATKEVRGTGEARKEYTTWHKVAVIRVIRRRHSGCWPRRNRDIVAKIPTRKIKTLALHPDRL